MIQMLATFQLDVGFQKANIGEIHLQILQIKIQTCKSRFKSNCKKVMNLFLLQQRAMPN